MEQIDQEKQNIINNYNSLDRETPLEVVTLEELTTDPQGQQPMNEMSGDTMDFVATLILDGLEQSGYLKAKDENAKKIISNILSKV